MRKQTDEEYKKMIINDGYKVYTLEEFNALESYAHLREEDHVERPNGEIYQWKMHLDLETEYEVEHKPRTWVIENKYYRENKQKELDDRVRKGDNNEY